MRRVGPRVAAASATFLALLGLTAGSALGDRVVETIYAEPVSYYVPTGYVATSRVVPSSYSYVSPSSYSYVVPSSYSYVAPASYATTAYSVLPTSYAVTPTTYYAPTYYRRGLLSRLFSRPVIETTRTYAYDVAPTSYYLPTTISLDSPVVATSYAMACNESPIPFNPPPPANTSGTADPASKSITSSPGYNGPIPPPRKNDPATPKQPMNSGAEGVQSPPEGPAPEKPNRPADPPAGGSSEPDPPPVDLPKPSDPQSTSSFRPRATELRARDGASSPNLLRGEVVSGLTGKSSPNLEVIFSDLNGRFPDKRRTTDANGAFVVFLPDGGWTIRVVDPASPPGTKAKEYGSVTSTGGRYLDADDGPIYSLRISN